MGVNKFAIIILLSYSIHMETLHAQSPDNDTLPDDLKEFLYNSMNEMRSLFKKFNINYSSTNKLNSRMEEIDILEFEKPYCYPFCTDNFVIIDSLSSVIAFLANLTPPSNIVIPEKNKKTIVLIANTNTKKTKLEVLNDLLKMYNLKIETGKINSKILKINFKNIVDKKILEIDSIKFNSLNVYEKENVIYFKDVTTEGLERFYYFTTKQFIKIVNNDNVVIKYLKLDKSSKEILDNQLQEYYIKSKFVSTKQDFIEVIEK